MFLLIAVCINDDNSWTIKKIPVLVQRQYSKLDWYERLGELLTEGYTQIWVTQHSVPAIKVNLKAVKPKTKSLRKLQKILKQWSNQWSTHWLNLLHKKHDSRALNLNKANRLWTVLEPKLEGKLLHIYELQKSVSQDGLNIELEEWFNFIFIWCWQGKINVQSGIERIYSKGISAKLKSAYKCARCANTKIEKESRSCYSCKQNCMYCSECVQLGKVKSCSLLFSVTNKTRPLPIVKDSSLAAKLIHEHNLSSAQSDAVTRVLSAVIDYYSEKRETFKNALRSKQQQLHYLIWAVTGAGKTEMIFPIIDFFLLMNLKVLIAIPRRDVVQELKPRICKAFPAHHIVALYGGSKQIWEGGDIYIATTHQLLRFDCYFDLVILDEMDAFPYYNNNMLVRAVRRVQKQQACFIQLTATVPKKEKINLSLGLLRYIKVPVRYHKQPLPVPQFIKTPSMQAILQTKQVPKILQSIVETSHKRGAVLFIFLQRKLYLQPFAELLKNYFTILNISYTSAEDPLREKKVTDFRERRIDVLLTTSILERGVTIKKSDICIVDAHQKAFNRTAIVQMAGRAGRSIDDPNGYVYLLGIEKTDEINSAIKEIVSMNKLARRKGYLREE